VFTGIIEERGEIVDLVRLDASARLSVRGPLVTRGAHPGHSIAVNGCCLTVTDVTPDGIFTADVMAETLARTTFADARPHDAVNLERPVPSDGRFGGHIVQGHVDGTGTILRREHTPQWHLVEIGVPRDLIRYVVPKGSIAVDGVSLTVVDVREESEPAFTVALIPTTLANTTLGLRQVGERVNLEVDVLAKYVQRLAEPVLRPLESGQPEESEGAPA